MATSPIYGKTLIFSYRSNSPMIMTVGMEHYAPKLYPVYINDVLELTLKYVTSMSNLAKLILVLIVGPEIRWDLTGLLVLCFIVGGGCTDR